jgi:hypothetical protein
MKQTVPARYYERLTPEERFRLDVLAMARGDAERLRLVEAFGLIIGAFAELAKLEADAYAERTTDKEHRSAHSRAHALARDMPERTADLQRSIAEGGLTVWTAFKGFCAEEMGLEARVLLGALAEPMADGVRELEEIAERLEVEADPETLEHCAATLRESWQRRIRKG